MEEIEGYDLPAPAVGQCRLIKKIETLKKDRTHYFFLFKIVKSYFLCTEYNYKYDHDNNNNNDN